MPFFTVCFDDVGCASGREFVKKTLPQELLQRSKLTGIKSG